jgi:hypothetical protein
MLAEVVAKSNGLCERNFGSRSEFITLAIVTAFDRFCQTKRIHCIGTSRRNADLAILADRDKRGQVIEEIRRLG